MDKLTGPSWTSSKAKRQFDVSLAVSLTPLVAAPALVGLAVSASQKGHRPIFRQERPGKDGELFTILKFRTMPLDTEESSSAGNLDPRSTRLGKLLRISKLDESPQILNVLRGDRSIVGPRPLVSSHIEQIMGELSPVQQRRWRQARSLCRPGMIDPVCVSMALGCLMLIHLRSGLSRTSVIRWRPARI